MKTPKHITLWDKITGAINDLEPDEPKELETDAEIVDRLIELAYHYRLEYNRLKQQLEEYEYDYDMQFPND